MKIASLLLAAVLSLSGCAPAATRRPAMATPITPPATPTMAPPPSPTSKAAHPYTATDVAGVEHTYFVDAWVDNPQPPSGSQLIVRGSLVKDGRPLRGMMMQAQWVAGGKREECNALLVYLAGCIVDTRRFAPGVLVPITVTLRYDGHEFVGYTGFTPQ